MSLTVRENMILCNAQIQVSTDCRVTNELIYLKMIFSFQRPAQLYKRIFKNHNSFIQENLDGCIKIAFLKIQIL